MSSFHDFQQECQVYPTPKENINTFEWKWPKKNTISQKDRSQLHGQIAFSEELNNILGKNNVENISGLDDERISVPFFKFCVEHEAFLLFQQSKNKDRLSLYRQLQIKSISRLSFLSDKNSFYRIDDIDFINKKLYWRHDFNHDEGGFVKYAQAVFGISHLDAIATIACYADMDYLNLTTITSKTYTVDRHKPKDKIPDRINLPNMPTGQTSVELIHKIEIHGNANELRGAILQYRWYDLDFCLPATVCQNELALGKHKPTAFFLNQDLMEKYPSATILLFEDMRSAIAIQKALDGDCSYDKREFIVSSHLGTDISILPWNFLYCHEVVFIPAPTPISLAKVKEYARHCTDHHIRGFRVASIFLLASPLQGDISAVNNLSEAEKHILSRCTYCGNIDQMRQTLKKLIAESVSEMDFDKLYQQLGVFKAPKGQQIAPQDAEKFALPPADPALKPAQAMKDDDVTVNHIVRPGTIVMIVGAKNAGKTQCSYALIASCIGKKCGIWFLDSPKNVQIDNICIVDGETPGDEIEENLKQYHLWDDKGRRLFVFSRFDPDLPEFASKFMVTDETFREGLSHYLVQNRCRVLVIDNLSALMGDNTNYDSAAQTVMQWIEELQKKDICVVLVVHKSEDNTRVNPDRTKGSQLFKIRSRVIINLIGKTEIIGKSLGTETIKQYAKQDGLTIGMEFTTCKTAPVLEKKTFGFHLQLGTSTWKCVDIEDVPRDVRELPLGHEACSVSSEGCSGEGSNDDLYSETVTGESPSEMRPTDGRDWSREEREVYKALKRLGKEARVSEVLAELKDTPRMKSNDTVRKYLKRLVERGVVRETGTSSCKSYLIIKECNF